MLEALAASGSELVTLADETRRLRSASDNIYRPLKHAGYKLLPNTQRRTYGRRSDFAAQLAREAMKTNWIKLEIHPDPRYLMPDPIETLAAAETLVQQGFNVLPYIIADPVLAYRFTGMRLCSRNATWRPLLVVIRVYAHAIFTHDY